MENMIAENYQAWDFDPTDFFYLKNVEEKLVVLVKFAVLAPSSHNSQPWEFRVKDNSIFVVADYKRSLPVSDSNNRQLFTSIGCAIENILIAASFYNLEAEIKYFPNNNKKTVVEIVFKNIGESISRVEGDDSMISAILTRSMNRNKYDDRMVDEGFLKELEALSSEEFKVSIIREKKQKDKIAGVVKEAIRTAIKNKGFRNELSRYLLSNNSKEPIGMPGFGFGLPSLISIVFPALIKNFDVSGPNTNQEERLLRDGTPAFVVISSKNDDELAWVKAGQLFQKIALESERQHIKTAVMAAAIQIGEFYKDLQEELGTTYRPQVFFRIGYSNKPTPHSPRLGAEKVISAE